MPTTAVAIVSGGLDSTTLAYLLHAQDYNLHLLSFDYGQRHRKELHYAQLCAERLNARWDMVDLTAITRFLGGSALTDDVPVPEGHYAAANMAITVVPNRNAIMLSVAYAIAVAEHAVVVAAGVHAGDHFIYPDCRPGFIAAFDAMQRQAVEGFGEPGLHSAFPTPIPGVATKAKTATAAAAAPASSANTPFATPASPTPRTTPTRLMAMICGWNDVMFDARSEQHGVEKCSSLHLLPVAGPPGCMRHPRGVHHLNERLEVKGDTMQLHLQRCLATLDNGIFREGWLANVTQR